ncbi:MAG: hypothetical protein ACM3ZT_02565 [Bacillota bacterium]
MDLAFLLVIILIAWGIGELISTIAHGDFATAVALIGLMTLGAAWWWTKDQRLVLRVPLGFWCYLAAAAVLGSFTVWTGSKIAVALAAGYAPLAAKYPGGYWSAKFEARTQPGLPTPWWLDQSVNLLEDLFRWVAGSLLAWFLTVVPPMLLVFVVPLEWVPWAALIWAFAATVFYIYKYRAARWRLFKLPLALYAFAITSGVLLIFQKQIAGPLEAGSFEQIAYVAFWPAVSALFTEFVVVGTRKAP